MSISLLNFIKKHEPRTIVYLSINGEECIGFLQVLHQAQIIDHDIEYKCKFLVKTWELIEIVNGFKSKFIYYHGFIGNEFHFKDGIIYSPYDNDIKIFDMHFDICREIFIIETNDILKDEEKSEHSSQCSLEYQDTICDCFENLLCFRKHNE